MQETMEIQVQSLGGEDLLEEEMAIHSSIFAWKIPQTEESGGLQFLGLERVGHNWAHTHSKLCTDLDKHAYIFYIPMKSYAE